MALIGYWNFKDAPQQNVVADSAGSMDITHGGGHGAGWWRDDPDYAIFGGGNANWAWTPDTANRPDPTPYSGLSLSYAMKALSGQSASSFFSFYGNHLDGYKGWGLVVNYSSTGSANSVNSAKLWDGTGTWKEFSNPNGETFPSVTEQRSRYHSIVVNIVSGGNSELYINGAFWGTVSTATLLHDTTTSGQKWGVNYSYTDNIQYHDRVLTASEIALHAALPRQWHEGLVLPEGLGDEWAWYCPTLNDSVDDISGNGNNGTILNGLTTTADTDPTFGGTRAYDCDAPNKGFSVAQDILLGETAYTYSVWYKPTTDDTGGADRIILGAYGGGNSNSNIFFVQNDADLKMYAISDSGTTYTKFFTQAAVAGEWVHLCITVRDSSAGYYSGYLNGIPFVFYQYLGAGKDTGRTGLPFYVGGGGTGSYAGAGSLIDDFRLYKRTLSDAEVEHLSLQRGQLGKPTFTRVNIRKDLSYITDTDKFSACQPNSSQGQAPYTWEYNDSQKFGWIGQSIGNFRNRNASGAAQLAGIGFTSTNGVQFRIDLPQGPGTYRVYSAAYDALANQRTGWDIHDGGTSGTLIGQMTQQTAVGASHKYVDATDQQIPTADFDWENENYIEHTFTGDHVTWTRNTSITTGTGVLSSAWVEFVPLPEGLGDEEAWYCASLEDSANDLSGNGNHGIYSGGAATVDDTNLGGTKAYEFNGSSTYMHIYDNGVGGVGGAMDFLASADWTASFYAKCDNDAGNSRDPFFGSRTRSGYTGWYASNNDNNSDYTITTGVSTTTTFYKWTNDPQLDTDWHHVCFVNNGGTVSLYVDNVLSGTTNSIPDLSQMTSFFIGRAANYFYFDGRMDDIRFYSRAISASEVAHLATSRGVLGGPDGPDPPDPPSGFYNPFSNKTFNPNYTRRIG